MLKLFRSADRLVSMPLLVGSSSLILSTMLLVLTGKADCEQVSSQELRGVGGTTYVQDGSDKTPNNSVCATNVCVNAGEGSFMCTNQGYTLVAGHYTFARNLTTPCFPEYQYNTPYCVGGSQSTTNCQNNLTVFYDP